MIESLFFFSEIIPSTENDPETDQPYNDPIQEETGRIVSGLVKHIRTHKDKAKLKGQDAVSDNGAYNLSRKIHSMVISMDPCEDSKVG